MDNINSKKDSTEIIIESCYVLNSSKTNNSIKETEINKNKEKSSLKEEMNFQITEFQKIIGNHQDHAEFVKELENFYIISCGTDNKLIFYNSEYEKIKKLKKGVINNICEININELRRDKRDEIKILITYNDKLELLNIKENNFFNSSSINLPDCLLSFPFYHNVLIVFSKKGVYFIDNIDISNRLQFNDDLSKVINSDKNKNNNHEHIFYAHKIEAMMKEEIFRNKFNDHKKIDPKMYEYYKKMELRKIMKSQFEYNKGRNARKTDICDKIYKDGIKINKNLFAFASNSIIRKGEDKLKIYNFCSKRIVYEMEGYSFILSQNGLSLIPREEVQINNRILLCACKKYKSGQKNGILLINFELEGSENISKFFYETGNFEVYCFCPILNVTNSGYILSNTKIIKDTRYFLVGGFDVAKNKGLIKLYKVLWCDKHFLETKIEYIQDIEPEYKNDFKDFKGPISCITQSLNSGNLLISCFDGNIYVFSPPNIDYFVFYDEQNN